MRNIVIALITMFIVMLSSTGSYGVNAGDGIYEYNLCNCTEEGIDYFPENKTLRFTITPLDYEYCNTSYGLGLLQAKYDPSRTPSVSQIRAATLNDGRLVNMLKNVTIVPGEFKRDESENTTIQACRFIEVYFYLFANHSVLNEGPIRHYMTNGTGYHEAYLDTKTISTPVVLSMSNDNQNSNTNQDSNVNQDFILLWFIPPIIVASVIVVDCIGRRKVRYYQKAY